MPLNATTLTNGGNIVGAPLSHLALWHQWRLLLHAPERQLLSDVSEMITKASPLNLAALRSGLFHGLIFLFLLSAPALAQPEPGPKVHARLVAEDAGVAPGGTVTVALEEKIAAGWHTYWKNPGDAGAPTEIEWTLPPGWKAGPIQWPRPKRLPVGPLMDYGYEGTPWLLDQPDGAR